MKLLIIIIVITIIIIILRLNNLKSNNSSEHFTNNLNDEQTLEIIYDDDFLIFKPSKNIRNDLSTYTIYIEDLHDPSLNFQVIRFSPPQNLEIASEEIASNHDCTTKEVWRHEKKYWCCKNKNIGCDNPTNNNKKIEIKTKLTTMNRNIYNRIYVKCNYIGTLITSNIIIVPPKKDNNKYDALKSCKDTLNKYPNNFPDNQLYKSIFSN